MPRKLPRIIATISLLALAAASPLLAQNPGDRVELIMGGLPKNGSPEYNAIIKHAGDAKGQVLPLTKTEMWNIPRSKLDNLKKVAAGKKGVTVKELGTDWNQVLTPMAPAAPMDAKQKSMMDMAMKSKSTAGVGMMEAPVPGAAEYALTKDMDAKGRPERPHSIKITLDDKTTVTALRTDVVIEDNRCVWRGLVEGTDNSVTIMWWGSGRMTGTIHYSDRIYQLKDMTGGMIGVVKTMTEMMPDEHARASPKRMQEMRMQQDTIFMQGDASMGRPKREATENRDDLAKGAQRTAKELKNKAETAAKSKATAGKQVKGKAAKAGPQTMIDVMVVYTAKAAMHYGDIKRDLIELAIEETNQSFRKSNIDNLAVRLVHTIQTDYVEGEAEHFDHLWRMVDRGDGFMEEIPKLRDEKKADVVLLVVDDAQGCGLATRVAADADEAYAVVHHECASTSYSVAHEIGHLIGARHDRSLDMNATPFPFGHGYVNPGLKWRTMMSYKAGCNGCPRLPVWSSPTVLIKGELAGDTDNNNARVIADQAGRVARFR